jgi:hypothetical protein
MAHCKMRTSGSQVPQHASHRPHSQFTTPTDAWRPLHAAHTRPLGLPPPPATHLRAKPSRPALAQQACLPALLLLLPPPAPAPAPHRPRPPRPPRPRLPALLRRAAQYRRGGRRAVFRRGAGAAGRGAREAAGAGPTLVPARAHRGTIHALPGGVCGCGCVQGGERAGGGSRGGGGGGGGSGCRRRCPASNSDDLAGGPVAGTKKCIGFRNCRSSQEDYR